MQKKFKINQKNGKSWREGQDGDWHKIHLLQFTFTPASFSHDFYDLPFFFLFTLKCDPIIKSFSFLLKMIVLRLIKTPVRNLKSGQIKVYYVAKDSTENKTQKICFISKLESLKKDIFAFYVYKHSFIRSSNAFNMWFPCVADFLTS